MQPIIRPIKITNEHKNSAINQYLMFAGNLRIKSTSSFLLWIDFLPKINGWIMKSIFVEYPAVKPSKSASLNTVAASGTEPNSLSYKRHTSRKRFLFKIDSTTIVTAESRITPPVLITRASKTETVTL